MHGLPGLRNFPARLITPRSITMLLASALVAASSGAQTPRGDGTGTLVGLVTAKDGGIALGYSVVSVVSPAREQFTNDQGLFVLAGLPPGAAHLRVRHLGYVPVELDVEVRAGIADTVRIALAHIVVHLDAMRVRAYPPCDRPGAPSMSADPSFATVFDQLRQNAEQYRLLTRQYPFIYGVERTSGLVFASNVTRRQQVDTIAMRSTDEWRYRPGSVVQQERRIFFRDVTMHIPTLAQFADPVFVANHCFHNAGVDTVDGQALLRIDFLAAARIREPDVEGALYLDPVNFQIRRTVLRLSKTPPAISDLLETEATTLFAELVPSVPIIAAVSSINRLKPSRAQHDPVTATTEEQRLIAVEFTRDRPGEPLKSP
jgi:hypothetical protein